MSQKRVGAVVDLPVEVRLVNPVWRVSGKGEADTKDRNQPASLLKSPCLPEFPAYSSHRKPVPTQQADTSNQAAAVFAFSGASSQASLSSATASQDTHMLDTHCEPATLCALPSVGFSC